MNKQTRALYDENISSTRNVISERPVKYVTNLLSNDRTLKQSHPKNIDKQSELRMKPTRLNYFNRPEGELFGTAPMAGKDARGVVDVESFLRNSESFQGCNKSLTERTWETNDYLSIPLMVDSAVRPSSTRANLRNEYCKVGNKNFNPNTHHKK
jgi:hypothetical protein